MKQWFVYILECCDGSFYTGVSNDVDARMEAHAAWKEKTERERAIAQIERRELVHSGEIPVAKLVLPGFEE